MSWCSSSEDREVEEWLVIGYGGVGGRGARGCFYTVCLGMTGILGAMGRPLVFLMRLAAEIPSVNLTSSSLGSSLGSARPVAPVGVIIDTILLGLAICVLNLLSSAAIITWSSSRCSLTTAVIYALEVAVAATRAAFRSDYQAAVAFSN